MKKTKTQPNSDSDPQFTLFQVAEIPNAYRKAVQVVHSKPREHMTLLQRKLSNAWLKNAVESEADAEGWWTIGVRSMAADIGFDSNNREYLRETALELMRIVFEWDVVAQEKKRINWKASVLYPEVEIRGDIIKYQISGQLKKSVLNPEMYALIDLNIIKRFRRASSLAIYEHCIRFEKIGRTAEVQWEQFRDIILGESAEATSYKEYKYFNAKVLKPSIAEINAVSDITIEIKETRVGKRVDTLLFFVAKTSPGADANPADESAMLAIGELVKIGIPQSEARKIVRTSSMDEVRAAIDYTLARNADVKQPKIANVGAYFRRALENKWGLVVDVKAKPSTSQKQAAVGMPSSIEAAYYLQQTADAEKYFKELDVADQDANIHRYNSQQQIDGLRIKKAKTGKGAHAAFFRWLGMDTWGEPTTDQLLKFATELMTKNGSLS